MITLAFDKYDFKRKTQYPNGWNSELYKYADTLTTQDYFKSITDKFKLASNHSELRGNILNKFNGKYVILDEFDTTNYSGETLFYPIEIYGNHNYFIDTGKYTTDDGIQYNVNFINVVSNTAIELAKLKKLYFVFNVSHEPFSDVNFLKTLLEQLKTIELNAKNFIIFGGSSNLLEMYPHLQDIGFTFYFENNLLISSCKKIQDIKMHPTNILGYKSEYIKESEILVNRTKHFVCPNRNSNKEHRFTLGCFFESKNLWNKIYASFLFKPFNVNVMSGLNTHLIQSLKDSMNSFIKKLPIQMDTEFLTESQKESFEVMKSFKKEIYLDSYIHIVTETNFKNDIFPTEKIINPIVVLQPFILFGAPGYLKYIQSLGFKTFNGFIDESYDNECNDELRFELLCKEIDRLSNLSLYEIHNWYISIIPILEYNRNFAIEFGKKSMFINNLKKHI